MAKKTPQAGPETDKDRLDRTRLGRQWQILVLLDKRDEGFTLKELATRYQTNEKTIDRDLKLLQSAGFPIESTNGPHGRKSWCRVAGLIPSINLTLPEAAAIYLGRKLMEPLAGTSLWANAQQAYQKFQCTFDKRMLKYLDKLAQAFHATRFGTGNYSQYGKIIDDLMLAIENRKVVTLAYHSQDITEPVTRDIQPYHLVCHRGTLYLVAYAEARADFRKYKVDRVSSVEVDAKSLPFDLREFDLDEYLSGSFGIYHGTHAATKVVIRFQPAVVRYVEEKHWHETEVLERQSDGSLLASFVLTDFHEVKSWVLSFGPNARVLEPPELIEEIRKDLQKTIHCYEQPAPSRPAVPPSKKTSRPSANS
ncbi:MAG: transcriptional regulator [Planctomycetota bacterium]